MLSHPCHATLLKPLVPAVLNRLSPIKTAHSLADVVIPVLFPIDRQARPPVIRHGRAVTLFTSAGHEHLIGLGHDRYDRDRGYEMTVII